MIKTITFIGSGNVATQLATAFNKVNIKIQQILSRNKQTGKKLALEVNAEFITSVSKLIDVDLIIICVNDDNILKIIKKLPNRPIVHTSGNTSMDIFTNQKNHGVIYPLQSLNQDLMIDFQNIPICVEANSESIKNKLITLSQKISKKVIILNSKKRQYLHLAAVIASNFSNYCYLLAKNILEKEKIDFDLLNPLIQYTAEKNLNQKPKINQTGPAKRGDLKTIQEHLNLISDKNYKKIYKLLSESILKEYES